ncbi:MFS transporter [Saccharopolyspora sp. ASAGF58]|nr:MFS transporter [Saccharopolyspora sp. ASAGF58]
MSLNSAHVKIGIALFVAFAIEAWEMLLFGYITVDLQHDLKISVVQVGLAMSALFFGMIPGAVVGGAVADRIGRSKTTLYSFAAYGVLALASSFMPTFGLLLVTRALAGFALAGCFTIGFLYFEELLPVRSRGRATVYLAAGTPVGLLLAVGVAATFGTQSWRLVVAISAAASLWALVVYRWVPESPYWLARQGRSSEAYDVLARLGATGLKRDRRLTVPNLRRGSLREVFRGGLARITALQVLINFLYSWGFWGVQAWMPILLQNRGLSAASSLGFVAISALFMVPGYMSASWLTGRFGRKKIFLAYVLGAAVGGYLFAFAHSVAALYAGVFVLNFFSLGAWGVWDAWLGELYPSPVRGIGSSLGFSGQRVANTVAPTVVGIMIAQTTGFSTTVLLIDIFLVGSAVLALALPETEGKELA